MKFLYNAPAIFHKKAIIVGDTHFGMEEKLRRKGIFDDQFSARLFEKLKELVLMHKANRVIFLGDVKEDITVLDRKSEDVLSKLSLLCKITIVRGNHDGGIERCGNAEIIPAEGFVYEGVGLIHGHSWPSKELLGCRYMLTGHQHPMVAITDAFGKRHSEPAWIIAPPNHDALEEKYPDYRRNIELVLVPAFNPIVGSVMNSGEKEHLGPLLNNKLFKLNDALVFRLDGACLGKLGEL